MIILDIETTGFSPETDDITEIGALKVVAGVLVDTYSQLIDPKRPIPPRITEITGITDAMVAGQPTIEPVMRAFIDFCGDDYIVGHNVGFDYGFLRTNAERLGLKFTKLGIDTLYLANCLYPELPSKSLTNLICAFDIDRTNAHRAFDDAKATYELLELFKLHPRASVNQRLFEPKPIQMRVKKTSPITPKQIKFLRDLCNQHQVILEKKIEDMTKSEASKAIDQILSNR